MLRKPDDSQDSRSKGRVGRLGEPKAHDFCCTPRNTEIDPCHRRGSELLAWFAADKGEAIPPCHLLDVVTTLAGDKFELKIDLGAKLIDEFGSVGGVLFADSQRLRNLLELEGRTTCFIDKFCLLLKATAALMKKSLAEDTKNRPVISSWRALTDYLRIAMGSEPIEHFRVIFLDKQNVIIKDEVQQRGTVDHTPLYPREVAKRSLELCASAVILVHNHPNGNLNPSRADIEMTKQVEGALSLIRVSLHDHLIIGSNGYSSFRTRKYI